MIITLYRYFGVLAHEKVPVYADHYIKDYGTCSDEIKVEFPDFKNPNFPDKEYWWQNGAGEWCFEWAKIIYKLNECIIDCNGVPTLRVLPPTAYCKATHCQYIKGKILDAEE